MRTHLLVGLVFLFAGCGDTGGTVVEIPCDLTVGPQVLDAGDVALGTTGTAYVELSANGADCDVISLSVLNLVGDYFVPPTSITSDIASNPVEFPCTDAKPDDQRLTVKKGETCFFPVYYAPLKEGYHQGQVQVSFDGGVSDDATTQIRGHADVPKASVFPWTIDFGSVQMGETRRESITISNESSLRLAITGVTIQPSANSPFTIEEPLPFYIEPNATADLEVFASPVLAVQADEATIGSIVLLSGQEPLQTVRLRMNDCANGTPSAYDRDQDGFTTCGGDCDDTNEAVRPGAVEIADGADNDCNTLIDDTTPGFDDDGDGYCDHPTTCVLPVLLPNDCNDGDPDVHPGVAEFLGDGVDNDCDGAVDGGTLDYDADGYTEGAGDCAPYDPDVFPAAPELADGKDNDCDTYRDEGTVLFDDDGDGYCEGLPAGGRPCTDNSILGDCNDVDDATHLGAPELDDWRDNDCDAQVDEGTRNFDDDGDGYTEGGGDCNDSNRNIGPASLEVVGDGIDNDCDPTTPVAGEP
jgi:hypothetical protein